MLYKSLFQLYPDNFQNNYFLLSDKLEDIRYLLHWPPLVVQYLLKSIFFSAVFQGYLEKMSRQNSGIQLSILVSIVSLPCHINSNSETSRISKSRLYSQLLCAFIMIASKLKGMYICGTIGLLLL